MVIEKCLVICSLLFLVSAVAGSSLSGKDAISNDYYYGKQPLNLRTEEQFKWKKVSEYSPVLILQLKNYYDDDSSSDVSGMQIDEEQLTPVYVKKALRHHIAHFCPNLDDARVCIRKCAKEGKPAFCGKDHVCYCGHRYSARDKNEHVDADDVYAQFRDLYEKYFGKNTDDNNKSPSENSEIQALGKGK